MHIVELVSPMHMINLGASVWYFYMHTGTYSPKRCTKKQNRHKNLQFSSSTNNLDYKILRDTFMGEVPQKPPQGVLLVVVLAFEEKRAKKPHIIDGVSPILGFPGYILCLFVDGV